MGKKIKKTLSIELNLRKRIKHLEDELSATTQKATAFAEREKSLIEDRDQAKSQEAVAIEYILQTLKDYKNKIVFECQKRLLDVDFGFLDEVDLPDKEEVMEDINKYVIDVDSGNNPSP